MINALRSFLNEELVYQGFSQEKSDNISYEESVVEANRIAEAGWYEEDRENDVYTNQLIHQFKNKIPSRIAKRYAITTVYVDRHNKEMRKKIEGALKLGEVYVYKGWGLNGWLLAVNNFADDLTRYS